jgi:hypothetical protein
MLPIDISGIASDDAAWFLIRISLTSLQDFHDGTIGV